MNDGTTPSSSSPPAANAVSLKLPDFWPSDPELWFAQVEAQFDAQGITSERTKFGHVVRVLPAQYASEVRDVILQPPENPYTTIKAELQKRVCPSRRQQLQQLIHVEDLGDRKPSQFLRHLLKLRGGTMDEANGDEMFRELFLQKLPLAVRTTLAIFPKTTSLSDLADVADSMAEVQGPQDTQAQVLELRENPGLAEIRLELNKIWREVQSQRDSVRNHDRTTSSGLCWYHERFGANAKKCREPCNYNQQSGNERASR